MNLISLLILPAVINLRDNDGMRFTIAGVSLLILIVAIAYSKRRSEGIDDPGTHAAVGAQVAA
jgi:hypothetical protein